MKFLKDIFYKDKSGAIPNTIIQYISLPQCFILNETFNQTIKGDLTMKYFSTKCVSPLLLIIVLSLLVCGSTLAQFTADTVQTQDVSEKEGISEDLTQLILGKWEIAPNKRSSKGSITFNQNGKYELHEQLQDGTGVGTKGEYKLNSDATPIKIDLCLDKCSNPGSEWTTRFGIIRVLTNEKLEIRTSPDSNYPSDFSDDTFEEYTMILTRAK